MQTSPDAAAQLQAYGTEVTPKEAGQEDQHPDCTPPRSDQQLRLPSGLIKAQGAQEPKGAARRDQLPGAECKVQEGKG